MKIKLCILMSMFSLMLTTAFSQLPSGDDFTSKLVQKADREQKENFNKSLQAIIKVSSNTDLYSKFIVKVDSSLRTSADLNNIARKINPSDSTLTGQSYTTFIQKTAKEVFTSDITDAENKSRIESVIKNLADKKLNQSGSVVGSIINGFVTSNPVLSLATNIVSGIATFFKTKKEKILGKEVVGSLKDPIKTKQLQDFKDKIKVYSEFYDEALSMNIQFGDELKKLIAEASANDTAARAAIDNLKKYGTEEIKINVGDISALQGKFGYNFEELYFNKYDNRFFVLLSKAKKIDSIYLLTVQLDKRAQSIIRNYVTGVDKLAKNFLAEIKKGQKEKVSAAFVAPKFTLNSEEFKAESAITSMSFSNYKSAFAPTSSSLASDYSMCCSSINWRLILIVVFVNIFVTIVLVFYFKKRSEVNVESLIKKILRDKI